MSNVALPETGDPGLEGQPARTPTTNVSAIAPRPGFYAWYFFTLMFLINFINYADRWVFSALSDVLKQQFNFDDAQIGFLASAFLVVYTLVAFPLGYIADRLSRKLIVAVGVALWSVATMLTPLAGNFAVMTVVRSLVGVGEGSYYPAGTPMLSAWFPPKRRATILSIWGVGAVVGAGVGFLLAGALAGGDWRLAFYITGIPGLLLAALMVFARNKLRNEADPVEKEANTARSFWTKVREYLRIPTLRVILGMHALGFFALTSLTTFLTIYLGATYGPESSYGAASISKGLVALIPGVLLLFGGLLGGLSGGFWANLVSRRRSGARVLVSGFGFLYAMPFVFITLLAPYILHAIPAYVALAPKTQVSIGLAIFAI
ncbi:MAG: MFS transporter, partial [Ktedonobacterales bacterium]